MNAPCAVAQVTQVDYVAFLQEIVPRQRRALQTSFALLDLQKACLGAMLQSGQRQIAVSICFPARGVGAETWMFDLELGLAGARFQ